jgi:fructokinase
MIYGGIEAGGTKWVCAIGSGPDHLSETVTFPTTLPEETLARAAAFFSRNGSLAAVGIGSFGPLDVRPGSPTWGHITTTPKPGWTNTDLVAGLRLSLDVPVTVDTDVNAAALGEQRWGAAKGLKTFCYITVGTGIGGGAVVDGRLLHGMLHPEIGHMLIPHDRARDPFAGVCPYHGDCFEGLASGEAIAARWGMPAGEIEDEEAWRLEAEYLALGVVNVIYTLSPERIILGGGVMKQRRLLPLVRARVRELLAGYVAAPELADGLDEYLVAPGLGDRAGVLGAIELARQSIS